MLKAMSWERLRGWCFRRENVRSLVNWQILLLSFFLISVAGLLIILEFGGVTHTQVAQGPFEKANGMLALRVSEPVPGLTARDDEIGSNRSRLKLWLNGISSKAPHALHQDIREGRAGGFSHWRRWVYFSLPPGTANSPATKIKLVYPLQLASAWMTYGLLALLAAIWLWATGLWSSRESMSTLLALPATAASYLVLILFAATALYGVVTIWAVANHWALPTTAIIRLFHIGRVLAFAEPQLPSALLMLAVCGAVARWIAIVLRADTAPLLKAEARLSFLLLRLALPIILALGVFSVSALWAGLYRPGDVQYMSIMGLVPFSDAGGYFTDANLIIRNGLIQSSGQHRPLAEAMRTTEYALSGLSYTGTLFVQVLLFAVLAFIATIAVARRCGVWAGIAFFAMVYAVGREFLPNLQTESLGLLWALAAIPFLIDAIGERSRLQAIVGSAALTVGLLVRMGSMFTIPALLLWVAWQFGSSLRAKLLSGALATLALLSILALSMGVAKIYAGDVETTGSNFAYTLCGISVGGDWTSCSKLYKSEITPKRKINERAITTLLYEKALTNIAKTPMIAIKRLLNSSKQFVEELPLILTEGYRPFSTEYSALVWFWLGLAAIGLIWYARHGMSILELSFWGLFWASTILSSGFVFADDGRRVMMVSYPLIALFFATGFSPRFSKDLAVPSGPMFRAGTGAWVMGLVLVCVAVIPYLMHIFAPHYYPAPASPNERLVFGGRRISGVMVVADDVPLKTDVASIHVSDFANIIRHTAVEQSQDIVTPHPPPLPFAFIVAPERIAVNYYRFDLFIAPPKVLSRPDVSTWRFDVRDFGRTHNSGVWWSLVTKAEAIAP